MTVRVCKLDHPKISRRLEAIIDTHSFISKLPEATWQELGVKPLFKHRETRKPAGLTKGRARLSLPVLTSMGYWEDSETGRLHWSLARR